MDISSIFYAALGGGGGAGLGVGLFYLFQTIRSKNIADKDGTSSSLRGGLAGGLAVAGGLLCSSLYKNMTLPRVIPFDDSQIITDVPVFGIIKKQSPDDYEKIIFPIDRATRNGGATQADLDEGRVIYFKLIAEKTQFASGASLRLVDGIAKAQYEILREKAPRICTLMLNSEPFPALEQYFSAKEIQAEQDVMVNLFVADPRDPNFVPDTERGRAIVEETFLQTMQDMGITNLRPDTSETAGNEAAHKKICDLGIAYLEDKQALEDDDFIHVAEYLRNP